MNPRYKFLMIAGYGTFNEVHPIWNDLNIDFEKESNQEFFRRKLSGTLTFVRDDYQTIMSSLFDAKFTIKIQMDNGNGFADYWQGFFYRTDCEINEDDEKITVTPGPNDTYSEILAGLEKEYNLINLEPEIYEMALYIRPVIQVYIQSEPMSARVGCFLGNTYWEQDCTYITGINALTFDYHFYLSNAYIVGSLTPKPNTGTIIDVPLDITSLWRGDGSLNTSEIENWQLILYAEAGDNLFKIDWYARAMVLRIYAMNDIPSLNVEAGDMMWEGTGFSPQSPSSGTLESEGSWCDLQCSVEIMEILWSRLLTNETTYREESTYALGSDDIVSDNGNYKRVIPIDISTLTKPTITFSSIPTKWGKKAANQYYISPDDTYMPIAMSAWTERAYWLKKGSELNDKERDGRTFTILKNAYALDNVISLLLAQVAPNIQLGTNTFVSYIKDNVHPTTQRRLFITPKSNIKKIYYNMAAMEAPITLKHIFDMLRDCYRAYWYVDANNKLQIEHIEFFINGGHYPPDEPDVIDLTQQIVTRNGKQITFGQNKYKFDKASMPERYEFGWMDDETQPFNGEPINIKSNFVEKGNIEIIKVDLFSSDIDYIMANPSYISDDGFVLMSGWPYGNDWITPILDMPSGSVNLLQNALCAFVYLQDYYLYDLPAPAYQIGDGPTQYVTQTKRTKTQEVNFPCLNDIDTQDLIKTPLGFGQIEKLTINLSSRNGKATLKFEV